jgi:hypothetical protein
MKTPCGGGLEYLHRSPGSCRRRRKGEPGAWGITGPPCYRGAYTQGLVPPDWRLDARLTTLPLKNIKGKGKVARIKTN